MDWLLPGLAVVLALALALWGFGQWRWSSKTKALLDRLEAARSGAAAERFDPRELAGLPEPVARHLRQVLPDGTPIIRPSFQKLLARGTRAGHADDDHACFPRALSSSST